MRIVFWHQFKIARAPVVRYPRINAILFKFSIVRLNIGMLGIIFCASSGQGYASGKFNHWFFVWLGNMTFVIACVTIWVVVLKDYVRLHIFYIHFGI